MKVTEITARFLRRIQVAEYQPAEAELTIKITSSEESPGPAAGDAQALIDTALKQAKTGVINILLAATTKQTPTAAPVTTAVAPKPETPATVVPKEEAAPKAASKKKDKPAASEIPDDAAPATPKAVETPKAAASEIPDAGSVPATPPAKSGEASMTPVELQSYVTEEIKAKRLNVPQMRDVMTEFKIVRLGDLDTPDKLNGFKKKIDEVIVTNGHKPGGK